METTTLCWGIFWDCMGDFGSPDPHIETVLYSYDGDRVRVVGMGSQRPLTDECVFRQGFGNQSEVKLL